MAEITGGKHTLIPEDIHCAITLTFGNFCSIASGLTIISGQHPGVDHEKVVSNFPFYEHRFSHHYPPCRHDGLVTIGSDVWIGQNVSILDGVMVGHGAVLAAEAVVVKDVEPYAVVAGNPAQVKKHRFNPVQIEELLKIAWWNWSDELIEGELSLMVDVGTFLRELKGRG